MERSAQPLTKENHGNEYAADDASGAEDAERIAEGSAIAEMTFEGTAGGGMVTAVARGDKSIESLTINPDVVDPEDVEMLQDMVCAAVNEALRGVDQMGSARMSSVTGGLNIPGMR